ncbi:MAG: glycosyltransferase family 4 protein [Candidatus Dormibacteraeota bacterium]|nr:glycosyltransferase family 4 protein [Candidatus Dormibacteraeota bacterium]
MSSPKRILMVQWEYAKDGGASSRVVNELASELLRAGHDVEVIAQAPYGPSDVESPPGLRLTLTSTRGRFLAGSHTRAWGQLTFLAGVLGRAAKYAHDKDCVITVDTPTGIGLAGNLIRHLSRRRVRHICWILDLYQHQLLDLKVPGSYVKLRRLRAVVDQVGYALASEKVVLGDCMKDYLRAHGVRNNVSVIPIWQDECHVHAADDRGIRERWRLEGKRCLLYSGRATYRHPLTPLVEAARRLPQMTLVLVGTGENIDAARRLAQEYRLDNVRVEAPVPAGDVNELLSMGEVHAVALDPAATGTCVPSKAYAAMAVGRPLIFLGDPRSQVARDIRASGCGASVDPGDLTELCRVLGDWLADPDGWRAKGQAGLAFFLRFREMRVVCETWLSHI